MPDASRPELDLIAKAGIFRGLPEARLSEILADARPCAASRDEFLFHEGDSATRLYVLLEGRVKLLQTTAEGHQVLLRMIFPGSMFGGIAGFGETTYPATAQALTDCRCLTWDGEVIRKLLAQDSRIAINALNHLLARLQEVQDRYRELATERVEQRVARALVRLVRQSGRKTAEGVLIDMPLSRQNLAEMTGTTLYTVSRILSAWEQQGLVKTGRERVTIRSPHGLVTLAEDLPPSHPPPER